MTPNNWLKNLAVALLSAVLLVGGVYLVFLARNAWKAYNYIGKTPDAVNQITVTGTAKITAMPDVAVVNIGLINEGATVKAAQDGVTTKMNSIISSLKNDFKVEAKDIQTENYSLYPKYDWSSGRQRIVGYTANQSVSVKVRNFDQIGDILAKATDLGSNSVSGPNFIIDDPETAKAEARTKAIAQAKQKAEILSDQVGIKLGKIVNFYEGGSDLANAVYSVDQYALEARDEAKSISPTIEPGSQDVQLTVSISYEIR